MPALFGKKVGPDLAIAKIKRSRRKARGCQANAVLSSRDGKRPTARIDRAGAGEFDPIIGTAKRP